MAKTLEYYFVIANAIVHVIFKKYTIDENGIIRNKQGKKLRYTKTKNEYRRVGIQDASGKPRIILIGRALASTFLGLPPTPEHTADHVDQIRANDTLSNIRWASKKEQNNNQTCPSTRKSAFGIVRDGEEKTNKEWADYLNSKDEKNHMGREYTYGMIKQYAQKKLHGFSYKEYPDLKGEVWKDVEGSNNIQGMWKISNMNRVKYVTKYAENVLSGDRLGLHDGYPTIGISGKDWKCHIVAFKTFFPDEWANKKPCEMVCHKEDDRMDFRPEMLELGTQSMNAIDAHNNGKYDGSLSERQKCASYIDGALEKEHESQSDAVEYLRSNGCKKANPSSINKALDKKRNNGSPRIAYGRTWTRI